MPDAQDDAVPDEAAGPEPAGEAGPEPDPATPARRHPFYLRGRRIRLPRSRAGIFGLLLVLAAGFAVVTFTGVSMIHWTETADFCGRCHTMEPELEAYHLGVHRDVTCGECHVEPGVLGWVKSKVNGTRQLVSMVLGTYATPIEAPDHAVLPSPADTCQTCHSLNDREFADLRTTTEFNEDEANSREFVGLMIRPTGGDPFDAQRSVHWHVLSEFTYLASDPNSQVIDYVTATRDDGTVVEYIAQDQVRVAEDVRPVIEALKVADRNVTLNCYDCHNRVGHDVANPRTGLDYRLSKGLIDPSLPYIKREGMRILTAAYPDEAAADAEIDRLGAFYQLDYPDIYATKGAQIGSAQEQFKLLYRLTSVPEMQANSASYINNLGHTDAPGCFRCHDGGHLKVVDGAATTETIPSTCNTCHTFPQVGPAVASLPLGEPPSTHTDDDLWVFNHKAVATSLDPGGQSCGECHAQDYCVNCHSTGAVTVDHDTMATNHAKVIRDQGNQACSYCHQPVTCARCHADPVLDATIPEGHPATGLTGPGTGQDLGLRWPLDPGS